MVLVYFPVSSGFTGIMVTLPNPYESRQSSLKYQAKWVLSRGTSVNYAVSIRKRKKTMG